MKPIGNNIVLAVLFSTLLAFSGISLAADKKTGSAVDEERQREIDKTLFMASATQERVLKIGLIDCITYALKNNSEIKIERIEPKLRADDVKIAKASFEPTATVAYTLHDDTEKSTSTVYPGTLKTRDTEFDAGVSGKLVTGTEYSVNLLNEGNKSSIPTQSPNPYYTSEPQIIITQPLFRDFGIIVNRADIIIAQNNKQVSAENFKDTVMDIISRTKIAYYSYIYYLENYALLKASLERAQDLLEINKARYEKGLLSSVDLLETETAMVEREKSLLTAGATLRKAEDDLKLITNLIDDPEVWNAKLELIDGSPEFKEENIDLLTCLKEAFVNRPDYNSQKIDLKSRDIRIVTAKNALLPTVDLAASFGLNGLGKDFQDALRNINSEDKDWSVGFVISVPWGGAERAKFNQRNLEKAQAILSFKRLEQNIILEVRDRVRTVDAQMQQVKVAKISKDKEGQNYEAHKERYAAGQVSTHDMLDYQEKLSQAELDYVKALIDYNTALINLDKSQGLTLVKNNVKLEEG
ncbi:MAG: TolC family protein [Deltaproteobacteria bacterium]